MAPRLRLSALGQPARRAAPWLIVVTFALALLVVRVVWSSHQELELGLSAYERGDRQAAVLHLERSAHWYAPLNPYVARALEELRQIGRQAEMEGQTDLALAAYRAIRSSCLGTRGVTVPHRRRLDEANQRIAALLSRQTPAPMDRTKTVGQRRDVSLSELQRLEQPSPFWSLVAGLALLGWIVAAFGFILRGLDDELRLQRSPALRWGGAFLLSLVLWLVGLLLA